MGCGASQVPTSQPPVMQTSMADKVGSQDAHVTKPVAVGSQNAHITKPVPGSIVPTDQRDLNVVQQAALADASGSQDAQTASGSTASAGDWDDWDDDADGEAPASSQDVIQPSHYSGVAASGLHLVGKNAEENLNVQLYCTSCGAGKVWRFPASRWDNTIDYYHVRNFAPDARMPERTHEDLVKLCTKLVRQENAAAYACGCSWQTVVDEKLLTPAVGTPAAPHGGARLEGQQLLHWGV